MFQCLIQYKDIVIGLWIHFYFPLHMTIGFYQCILRFCKCVKKTNTQSFLCTTRNFCGVNQLAFCGIFNYLFIAADLVADVIIMNRCSTHSS